MSDTTERDAVLERFYSEHYGELESPLVVDEWVIVLRLAALHAMADHIVELEARVEHLETYHE